MSTFDRVSACLAFGLCLSLQTHRACKMRVGVQVQDVPAAHTGFLNRARGVPIHHLYKLAKGLKKRLVLTGHGPHVLCMLALHLV